MSKIKEQASAMTMYANLSTKAHKATVIKTLNAIPKKANRFLLA